MGLPLKRSSPWYLSTILLLDVTPREGPPLRINAVFAFKDSEVPKQINYSPSEDKENNSSYCNTYKFSEKLKISLMQWHLVMVVIFKMAANDVLVTYHEPVFLSLWQHPTMSVRKQVQLLIVWHISPLVKMHCHQVTSNNIQKTI